MRPRRLVIFGLALVAADASWAGPMSYVQTFGPAGYPVTRLGWGLAIISICVCVIIALLLLGGIFHGRVARTGNDSRQLAVRRDAGGLMWIYIGVGLSSLVLIGAMIWTLEVTAVISNPPRTPAFTVQVSASQWWWALRYDNEQPSRTFTTANEIHIPVGQPVRFEVTSTDVIHSFWVPKLGGKMDVIPGQTNVTWLQADQPGVYRGECAVFCGADHARMALLVIAQSPANFRAWEDAQRSDAPQPATPEEQQGQMVFQSHCAACHSVRGTDASGAVGPDLSHLMSRRTLAAGLLPDTPGNLAAWIGHPQSIKPGSRMPDPALSSAHLAALVAYLQTLH
ncbi:MAG TPA: cytochrome c oxidase subunit II [Rhodanobacteraceae bacterium]|nr:cytochrome c oxidase subunit II [Rhodanobacteraceae bacterium]